MPSVAHVSARAAGRRSTALAAMSLAIAAACATPHLRAAEDPLSSVLVGVEHKGDAYIVVASLTVPVLPSDAWAVLTDFDHMADFMPTLKTSRVLKTAEGRILVQQRGTMEMGALRMPFESDRIIDLSPPGMIRSKQVRGNMQRVDSTTTFAEVPGGTRIDYRVEIVPRLWMPESIAQPLLHSEIERQFTAILREIVRRKSN